MKLCHLLDFSVPVFFFILVCVDKCLTTSMHHRSSKSCNESTSDDPL